MSIFPYWIALNFMSIWSFQHYMPVYSPKNIKRKFCRISEFSGKIIFCPVTFFFFFQFIFIKFKEEPLWIEDSNESYTMGTNTQTQKNTLWCINWFRKTKFQKKIPSLCSVHSASKASVEGIIPFIVTYSNHNNKIKKNLYIIENIWHTPLHCTFKEL